MTKKVHIKVTDNMVDAFVPGKPQDGGNLISDQGGKISWKHQASSLNSAFVVTFMDLETGQPGYPFIPYDSSLKLTVAPGPDKEVDLDPAAAPHWKYRVAVDDATSTIKPHDPMIIIRGRTSKAKLALVAGVSLAAGAAIGLLWSP